MQRAHSVSSSSSTMGGHSPNEHPALPTKTKLITRRRLTPKQAAALNKMFQAKSHPLKEERIALATEIGMDLKAVTIWFQNKRQIMKRNSCSTKENVPPNNGQRTSPILSATKSFPRSPTRGPLRAAVSLDHIAARCERLSQHTHLDSLSPATPNRNPSTAIGELDLWKRMPESPLPPPLSPSVDNARFSIVPPHSKSLRSLEWACARARVKPQRSDQALPAHRSNLSYPSVPGVDSSEDTDVETDEAVTPDSSVAHFHLNLCGGFDGQLNEECDPHPSSEVEAAMVLLGFKAQR